MYWRRRLVLFAGIVVLLVLVVLTVKTMTSSATGTPAAGRPPAGHTTPPVNPPSSSSTPHSTPTHDPGSSKSTHRHHGKHHHKHGHGHSSKSSEKPTGTPTGPTDSSATSTAPPQPCSPKDLEVQAVVGKSQYKVGDTPEIALKVTDVGTSACVQDLGASQVLLRIYNGESRVWSSHDCGGSGAAKERTLMVGEPVHIGLTWSGFTSLPGCQQDQRQRVGAGTYTLFASLAGEAGKAAQFSMV